MPSNYNSRGGPKKQDGKIADKFRDACPPHKVKDLDALVKQCKGDEAKIQAKITEWWDEPQIEEPQWESVGKSNKKAPERKERGGDRGGPRSDVRDRGGLSGGGRRGDRYSDRGGRDAPRRDGRGGRGSGGRYSDRDRDRNRGGDRGPRNAASSGPAPTPAPQPKEHCAPTPVTNVPGPKGAWGVQSFAAAAAASSATKGAPAAAPPLPTPVTPAPAVPEPKELESTQAMEPDEEIPVDLGGPAVNMISPEDPTPSGLPTPTAPLAPPVATGNVWGTKGGAHLIQVAKTPIPAPAPPAPIPLSPEVADDESESEPEMMPEETTPLPVVGEPLPEPELEPETALEPEETLMKESSFGVSLDSVLPPSVNGANINASGWEPILDQPAESSKQQQQQQPPVDISQPSSVGAVSIVAAPSMPEPEPVSLPKPIVSEVASPPSAVTQPSPAAAPGGAKPSSVLNMGHWETGDGDDNLDFGFGSFGAPENDTAEALLTETTASSSSANASSAAPSSAPQVSVPPTLATTTESSLPSAPPAAAPPAASATHASPARPPPGLSMPPMPAGAMLVHELEGKLDNTTLGPKTDNTPAVVAEKVTASAPAATQPQSFNAVNDLAGQMNPPGMSQYGGMGMYNIPPPGVPNGLGSMPPGQFPLDSGANNQQQPNAQQSDSRPGNPPSQLNQTAQQQHQQGPYGMQQTATSVSNNNTGAPGADATGAASGAPGNAPGMPPGMPSMQYPNPAYMYAAGVAGQFNQMGHPAYGMQAAAYGYGQQFAPQGGHQFGGYNQGLMGQGGGYGAPSHYDDQRGPRGGGGGGNMRDGGHQGGGYNKGGGRGGYRGGRNHHQNNHGSGGYGNNYQANPGIGGYGAGPYNMGYGHGGGYGNPGGPSGMDHYGMQQQQQQQQQGGGGGYGGFSHQDNDHSKKSSGPHGGQGGGGFQQQSHLHQQPLGLQGTSADTGSGGGAAGGWPGSRQQNWGGNWQQES